MSLPIRKTAAPMKTARKMWPDSVAMYSMKNAKDPANSVPNPLLSPLHKVAPIYFQTTIKPYVHDHVLNKQFELN